jgi:hypothetical protein
MLGSFTTGFGICGSILHWQPFLAWSHTGKVLVPYSGAIFVGVLMILFSVIHIWRTKK